MKSIRTIDDVIVSLDQVIDESKENNNPLGYFAALYRKVTIKIKEGIANDFFDDGERMEKLDVIFACRYLEAYEAYKNGEPITQSWKVTFELSKNFWPIVLQHLLIGMNAHINLDLGIAAAEVSKGKDIQLLKGDFDKINEILSYLVHQVESDLAAIWPKLNKLLKWLGKVDDFLVDFSMELARDGAWNFALALSETPRANWGKAIAARDKKTVEKGKLVTNPGWVASTIFKIIRLGERGTVPQKIEGLRT